jgi:methionyl-tRNA synthetase
VNRDLADVLGNFVNRILKFTESKFDGRIPAGGTAGPLEQKLATDVMEKLVELTEAMEAIEIRKSAQILRSLWVLGNEYLQEAAPWTAIKTDPERASVIVRTALNLTALYASVSKPFIPFAAIEIAKVFGLGHDLVWPNAANAETTLKTLNALPVGLAVRAPEVLFKKIEDEQIAEWTARFGGAE